MFSSAFKLQPGRQEYTHVCLNLSGVYFLVFIIIFCLICSCQNSHTLSVRTARGIISNSMTQFCRLRIHALVPRAFDPCVVYRGFILFSELNHSQGLKPINKAFFPGSPIMQH